MRIALSFVFVLILGSFAPSVLSAPSVRLNVSPRAAMEPAAILIRTTVEPNADNRVLEVLAQSDNFTRRSEISLDGAHAARSHEIRYRGLPAGTYEVSVTVVGSTGRRSTGFQSVEVIPSSGR